MPYMRWVIYVLVSMTSMVSALLGSTSERRMATATVVSAQLKTVLSGLSLYVINNWNNLVLATPSPISYTLPGGASRNVLNVLTPTASELMLLGFLSSPSALATTYPLPSFGGGYATALTRSPVGCQGNACSIELYAWLTSPVGGDTKKFDIHYVDNRALSSNISMGYSTPGTPSVINGPNNSWSYTLTGNQNAGVAMIHTYLGVRDFSDTYPCVFVACWKSPAASFASFPTRLNTVGDVRLEQSSGDLYFWTGSNWRTMFSNATFTSYLGANAGNTGSNNTYLGNSSGQALYVTP